MPVDWGKFTLARHRWKQPVERLAVKFRSRLTSTLPRRLSEALLLLDLSFRSSLVGGGTLKFNRSWLQPGRYLGHPIYTFMILLLFILDGTG